MKEFTQVFVHAPAVPQHSLKIDFVNGVAAHYGDFETNERLGTIDSWRNILSNKISALFRFESKDVADIWIISKKKKFDWKTILEEAKTPACRQAGKRRVLKNSKYSGKFILTAGMMQ